jgi:hypothetical protein
VQVLADTLSRSGRRRPVLVSGLPGLCVPASVRAWRFRSRVDLLLAHSRREQRGFTQVGLEIGARDEVALARLPFLDLARSCGAAPADEAPCLVFAAQAKVPATAADRQAVLLALDTLARARPDLRPVVKLRALAGEQQTHREELPYDVLWRDLVTAGRVRDGAVEFASGAMADHLARARGLATVSSTAALEAMAAGVPVLVLGSFGLDARMLNVAFAGSGVVGAVGASSSPRERYRWPAGWLSSRRASGGACGAPPAPERRTGAKRLEPPTSARDLLCGTPGLRRPPSERRLRNPGPAAACA